MARVMMHGFHLRIDGEGDGSRDRPMTVDITTGSHRISDNVLESKASQGEDDGI